MDTSFVHEKKYQAEFHKKERVLIKYLVENSLLSTFADSAKQVIDVIQNQALDPDDFDRKKKDFNNFTKSHQIQLIVDNISNETLEFLFSTDPNQDGTSPNSNQTSKWFKSDTMSGIMCAKFAPDDHIGKQWKQRFIEPINLVNFDQQMINNITDFYVKLQDAMKCELDIILAPKSFQPDVLNGFEIQKNDQLPTIKNRLAKLELRLTLAREEQQDNQSSEGNASTSDIFSFDDSKELNDFGSQLNIPITKRSEEYEQFLFGKPSQKILSIKEIEQERKEESIVEQLIRDGTRGAYHSDDEQVENQESIERLLTVTTDDQGRLPYRSRMTVMSSISQLLKNDRGREKLNEIFIKKEEGDCILFTEFAEMVQGFGKDNFEVAKEVLKDESFVESFLTWKDKEHQAQQAQKDKEHKDQMFKRLMFEQSKQIFQEVKVLNFKQMMEQVFNIREAVDKEQEYKLIELAQCQELRECAKEFIKLQEIMQKHDSIIKQSKDQIYGVD